MKNIMIILYAIISLRLFVKILRKHTVFGFVYLFLFLYSVFTMNAYVNFPQKLSIVSGGQYYGQGLFWSFYIYIVIFMLSAYVFYFTLERLKTKKQSIAMNFRVRGGKFIFYIIIISVLGYMLFKATTNFSASSYKNQSLLKSNSIWFYLFEFSGVTAIILLNLIIRQWREKGNLNISYLLFFLAYTGVVLITSLMFGQRIELFMLILGIMIMGIEYYRDYDGRNKLALRKIIKILLPTLLFAIFIFQFIRSYRGTNISNFDVSVLGVFEKVVSSFADLEYLTFQDWANPSLSLATCINYDYIQPGNVILANIVNLVSFFTHYSISITSPLRDLFAPGSSTGYGFYFATEGFMICGYLGCILSGFLIALYYRMYNIWFTVYGDKDLNCLIQGILGFYIISLVRSYSLFFIKGILFFIIPGMILYILATGKSFKRGLYYAD